MLNRTNYTFNKRKEIYLVIKMLVQSWKLFNFLWFVCKISCTYPLPVLEFQHSYIVTFIIKLFRSIKTDKIKIFSLSWNWQFPIIINNYYITFLPPLIHTPTFLLPQPAAESEIVQWDKLRVDTKVGETTNITCKASVHNYLDVVRIQAVYDHGTNLTISDGRDIKSPFLTMQRLQIKQGFENQNVFYATLIFTGQELQKLRGVEFMLSVNLSV